MSLPRGGEPAHDDNDFFSGPAVAADDAEWGGVLALGDDMRGGVVVFRSGFNLGHPHAFRDSVPVSHLGLTYLLRVVVEGRGIGTPVYLPVISNRRNVLVGGVLRKKYCMVL
mmetsp:Transcript_32384/g.64194  ORF Transcript_32384/g.64194 Transcript_32384/m.64194 type:complete len:112 (-) Transcript_32384:10-345(-)